jgi:RNA polymerase sigma-70 factor, ECF subfamily
MRSEAKAGGVAPQPVELLVSQACAGDREALSALAQRAAAIALRTAAVALADEYLARDISQEVAIRALNGLRKLRAPDRFDAWVYRITVSEVRRAASRRSRRNEVLIGTQPSHGDEPERSAGQAEDRLQVDVGLRRALAELSERERIALALRYVDDLDDAQIGRAMRCRPGTVRSLISRGRQKLRGSPHLADYDSGRAGRRPVLTPNPTEDP